MLIASALRLDVAGRDVARVGVAFYDLGPDRVRWSSALAYDRRLPGTEVAFGLVGVVSLAANLNIVSHCFTTRGERNHVVELQEATLRAPAARADERALPAVARPDLSLHRRGDVARPARR